MGSTRVKGNTLSMLVDGTDYWADATSVVMDNEPIPFQPFGGAPTTIAGHFHFDVTAVQSTDPDSFWTFLWDHQGEHVPFGYAPHGNEEPTEGKPHFTGVLVVPAPPALGGDAGVKVEQTFTTRLPIASGPLRVTTT